MEMYRGGPGEPSIQEKLAAAVKKSGRRVLDKYRDAAAKCSGRTVFGHMPDGTPVEEITLCGDVNEASCKILTYGGAVRSLVVPGRDGRPVDVVLGFDTLEDYIAQDKYIGALVGRYANRIGGAKFTLNGTEYPLYANDGENSLHGGRAGFDKQVWKAEEQTRNSVTLSLASPDGQEGYPGALELRVTYTLDPYWGLVIRYWARCDRDTVFNPTSHIYFNLSGHDSGPVTGHSIRLNASRYTPVRPGLIPTGEIAAVEGTPMDLRAGGAFNLEKSALIGDRIDAGFEQLALAGGYDHNWVIDRERQDGLKHWGVAEAAEAESPDTGILLVVHTAMPGVQFYAGNFLDGCPRGKGGAVYGRRCGFCLETQFFPDSPNRPEFPSCVLRAGEEFESATCYTLYPAFGNDGGDTRALCKNDEFPQTDGPSPRPAERKKETT